MGMQHSLFIIFRAAPCCGVRPAVGRINFICDYVVDGPLTAPDGSRLNIRSAWYMTQLVVCRAL